MMEKIIRFLKKNQFASSAICFVLFVVVILSDPEVITDTNGHPITFGLVIIIFTIHWLPYCIEFED